MEPIVWVCALLVAMLLVVGLIMRGQRREITLLTAANAALRIELAGLKAEVASMDGDGDGHIGGSRRRAT